MAVTGVGIYRIVESASHAPLAPSEGLLLAAAAALVMAAMTALGATSGALSHERRARWAPHLALAIVTLAAGATGRPVPPLLAVAGLAALAAGQVGLTWWSAAPARTRPVQAQAGHA